MGFAHAQPSQFSSPSAPASPSPSPKPQQKSFQMGVCLHMGVPRMTFSAPLALMTSW